MHPFSLSRIERNLDYRVRSPEGQSKFDAVRSQCSGEPYSSCRSWSDVRAWLREIAPRQPESDPALIPVISAVQERHDSCWHEILVFLLLDSIKAIMKWTARLDGDEGARFSEISWHLIQSAHRINLAQRSHAVGKKLLNDALSSTRSTYSRSRSRPDRQLAGPNSFHLDQYPARHASLALPDYEIDKSWAVAKLKYLVRQGVLTRADYQIILGCHIYGRSISGMATHLGVSYAVAKKRRQRAAKKLEKSEPSLSPGSPDSPLYLVERQS